MPRCPTCGIRLPEDRDRTGARCRNCRWPLYEPAGRIPRAAGEGEAACSVHPESASVNTCGRCGNFVCETCATRWDDKVQCAACVDRALRAGDVATGRHREHARQAALGLGGGVAAWLMTATAFGLIFVMARLLELPANSPGVVIVTLLAVLALPVSVVVALLGLGFSAAALRTRGDSMILATLGLFLSGLHVGALVGLFSFAIWMH